MPSDKAIYRCYLETMADPKKTAQFVCNKFGISRAHLYNVIRRVLNGNPAAIRRALETSRLSILWEHKYRTRFEALPKNREAATIAELRKIILAMRRDHFGPERIAFHLQKDRSTINHHLRA